jgi:hypothetical protein
MAKTKAQRRARQEQKKRQRIITFASIGVGVVVLIGIIVLIVRNSSGAGTATGGDDGSSQWETIPTQPGVHIETGDPYQPWNSDPPTSGYHYGQPMQPAKAGFYDTALPDENMVHSLEHGYIILWYQCGQLSDADCTAMKQGLKDVIQATGTYKVVAMPREKMTVPVIAVSWGKMYKQSEFDKDKLIAFVKANRENSPEPDAP